MQPFYEILIGMGWDVFGYILAIGTPLILTYLNRKVTELLDVVETKTGLDIEKAHREALHSAVESAVNMVLTAGAEIADDSPDSKNALAAARDYVKRSVPDAVRSLGAVDDVIIDLIKSKMRATVRKLQVSAASG